MAQMKGIDAWNTNQLKSNNFLPRHVFLARVSEHYIGQISIFHKNARRNVQDGSNERY